MCAALRGHLAVHALLLQLRHHGSIVCQIEAKVVVDALHRLPPVKVGHENASVGGVGRGADSPGDVPRISYHQAKLGVLVKIR